MADDVAEHSEIRSPMPPEPAVIVRKSAESLAVVASSWLAAALREAVVRRGIASLAVSGGSTPGLLFAALVDEDVAWHRLHLFQVDERIAPDGDPDRNLTELQSALLDRVPLPSTHFHPMPMAFLIDNLPQPPADPATAQVVDIHRSQPTSLHPRVLDPFAAAIDLYTGTLQRVCSGVIDVVHLGLGDDGHTASLIPGDPVLDMTAVDVAVTERYKGRHRMTLTYPVLDRAGAVFWLVAGAAKAPVLPLLVAHDPSIPAGRVRNENAVVFADDAAAALLPT